MMSSPHSSLLIFPAWFESNLIQLIELESGNKTKLALNLRIVMAKNSVILFHYPSAPILLMMSLQQMTFPGVERLGRKVQIEAIGIAYLIIWYYLLYPVLFHDGSAFESVLSWAKKYTHLRSNFLHLNFLFDALLCLPLQSVGMWKLQIMEFAVSFCFETLFFSCRNRVLFEGDFCEGSFRRGFPLDGCSHQFFFNLT